MKKSLALFLLVVVIIVTLGSCSASNGSPASQGTTPMSQGTTDSDREILANETIAKGEIGSEQSIADSKKIVRNAKLDIEAVNVKETYGKILDWAKSSGGYEFSQSLSFRGGFNVISAVIKIAPNQLDDFIVFIGECGDVINCNISSDDITAQYIDADLRLQSMRASLASYYKLLENAESIDEILKVQRIIDDITAQIESVQGKLNQWDSQVSESSVALYISEKSDPVKVSKQVNWSTLSFSDMGRIMKNSFVSVSNFLVTALQWILIVIVSILPIAIPVGAVIALVLYVKKRKRK